MSDRDITSKQFNNTLNDEIIDIITDGMIVEWMKPKLYFNEHMQNALSTADYKTFSPANMLEQIRNTYDYSLKQFKNKMNKYIILNTNIKDYKQ